MMACRKFFRTSISSVFFAGCLWPLDIASNLWAFVTLPRALKRYYPKARLLYSQFLIIGNDWQLPLDMASVQ